MLKNYMEIAVDSLLPSLLRNYTDACQCSKCVEDIKAIALNNLKPCYVVTQVGEIYVKIGEMEIQFKTDVIKELTAAIEKVTRNVKHNV